jgi:NAD(P)H-dependent FMN reductase
MADKAPAKVGIIVCSIRTPRVGPHVAQYVLDTITAASKTSTTYTLVDLYSFKLPVFDEEILPAMVPAMGSYTKPHTKAWSAEISQYAAYIFVTPEYNFGIPGATKNAVDFLYNEWQNKPVLVISYGISGGGIANASLCRSLEGMKMRVVKTRPTLAFGDGGGQGPELFAAVGGKLGDKTRGLWEEGEKGGILEGVGELEGMFRS